ncbi:MAG: hypothetical protein ACRDQJ_06260 [Pseudonocardiaceae bacterium]
MVEAADDVDAGFEAEVRVGGAADVQVIWLGEDVGIPSGRSASWSTSVWARWAT